MSESLLRNQSQDSLDALCDLLPLAVVGQSTDGLITRWDGEAERWSGRSSSEVVGRPARDLLRDEHGQPCDLFDLDCDDGEEIAAQLQTLSGAVPVSIRRNRFGDGLAAVTGAIATVTRRD